MITTAILKRRGTFRSSTAKYFIPESVAAPKGSAPAAGGGANVPMTRGSDGALQARFSVPASLAPVYLAFKLDLAPGQSARNGTEPADCLVGPASGGHFAVPIGMGRGLATLLGVLCPIMCTMSSPDMQFVLLASLRAFGCR